METEDTLKGLGNACNDLHYTCVRKSNECRAHLAECADTIGSAELISIASRIFAYDEISTMAEERAKAFFYAAD